MKLKLLLIVFSLILGLVFGEILLRVVGYSRPVFYKYDFDLGATLRPNTSGLYDGENLVRINLNNLGISGPERKKEKPSSTIRIAVLGDSMVEAFQVPYGKRFTEVVEKEVAQFTGKNVEVMNFGVSGFGTNREIQMYRHKAREFNPDIVLLAFFPFNDLQNNHPEIERNPLLPYFIFDKGRLVLDDSFQRNPVFIKKLKWSNLRNSIVNRVRVLQVITQFYKRLILIPSLKKKSSKRVNNLREKRSEQLKKEGKRISTAPAFYAEPQTTVWKDAWSLSTAMIQLLDKEVAKDGSKLFLIVLPGRDIVHPDPAESKKTMTRYGLDSLDYSEERLRDFAKENNIAFIPLFKELRGVARKNNVNFHYFDHIKGDGGHWNEKGHAEVGKIISTALQKNDLLRK